MDDRRFDDFARSIAGSRDRRRLLRGLAGGALAAVAAVGGRKRAAAQEAVGLGGACTATTQCAQDPFDLAVICGDNGIAEDGALNCCRNAGGGCGGGSGCCGALLCTNGVCTTPGETAAPGSAAGGFALGAQCSFAGQCDQTGGETDCADNGLTTDGVTNCCRYQGGACSASEGCCGGLFCVNGTCGGGSAPATGGLLPGATCLSTSQCSQAGGSVVCANNGLAADGTFNCCRTAGGACSAANDSAGCCANLVCVNGACA